MHPLLARAKNAVTRPFVLLLAMLAAATAAFAGSTTAAVAGLGLVLVIVGAIVAVLILAALADPFFDALKSLIENFTVVDLGSSQAATIGETIISVMAIVVAVAGGFLLVAFALKAFKARS